MKKLVAIPVKSTKQDHLFLAVMLEEPDYDELRRLNVDVVELKKEKDTTKKGWAFIAPVTAQLPATAIVVGTATLGIVGGAASVVGNRLGGWLWPDGKETKK